MIVVVVDVDVVVVVVVVVGAMHWKSVEVTTFRMSAKCIISRLNCCKDILRGVGFLVPTFSTPLAPSSLLAQVLIGSAQFFGNDIVRAKG